MIPVTVSGQTSPGINLGLIWKEEVLEADSTFEGDPFGEQDPPPSLESSCES
jgi:hypothetical protein